MLCWYPVKYRAACEGTELYQQHIWPCSAARDRTAADSAAKGHRELRGDLCMELICMIMRFCVTEQCSFIYFCVILPC